MYLLETRGVTPFPSLHSVLLHKPMESRSVKQYRLYCYVLIKNWTYVLPLSHLLVLCDRQVL